MSKPRTQFPYYKVQSYNPQQCSWTDDRKKAFDSLDEAKEYIQRQSADRQFRILVVEAASRRVLKKP